MRNFFRSSWGLLSNLTPNRVAVFVGALANITAALLPVLTDVGATDLIAPVAGLNALLVMFLKGWQMYEKAIYEAEQLQYAHAARVEATAQATAPRGSKINLPR